MTAVETERMVLRPWSPGDLDVLAAVFAAPAFWRYPFGRGFTRAETERFLDRQLDHWNIHGFGVWAAELRGGPLIGYVGLSIPSWLPQVLPAVEVGWRLHPDHWGKGLATEGGRTSLRYGFETLQLDRIISIFAPENVASGRVMEKLGMRDWITTPLEYGLLEHLATSPGQTFSRDQLLGAVWGSARGWQNPSTVGEHVHRIPGS